MIIFHRAARFRADWILPFDLDGGNSKGALERITESIARQCYLALSGDGRYVAFASAQSGALNIWIRELETGKESPVVPSSRMVQRFPVISASGRRVSFSTHEKDKRFVYVSTPRGVPEKVCEGCMRATDWSRAGSHIKSTARRCFASANDNVEASQVQRGWRAVLA